MASRASSQPGESVSEPVSMDSKAQSVPVLEHTNLNGVAILPIPPPLEFPRVARSIAESREEATEQNATTPGLLENVGNTKAQRQLIRRHNTERPQQQKRPTFLTRQRRQTHRHDVFVPGIWDSSSDDSSSSEDEPQESQKLTKTNSLRQKLSHPIGKTGHLAGRTEGPAEDTYSKFALGNSGYKTKGHVSKKDGRLKISLKEIGQKGYLAKALGATFQQQVHGSKDKDEVLSAENELQPDRRFSGTTYSSTARDKSQERRRHLPVPRLKIVIMVVGTRGDIQPFLRIGKILQDDYGHRVRIATHPAFREVVEKDSNLEFFSIGGDPAELMAFMVKNPGLIPKFETFKSGEIGKRREGLYEMFKAFWRACINATDDEADIDNLRMMGDKHPFVADAIIANPVSFAHIHCAERLGIPLHMMFTFPTSPTQQFPHPLANIKQSNVEANYTNFMTYPLVEMMQWQGLGDLINRFRVKTLGLEPMSTLWAPGQVFRQRVPTTYLWSPGLLPKPFDWGPEINVAGFVFLDLAASFKPPEELTKFLDAGDPPVYIGFGSIVVDDPDRFTNLIFEAVKTSGARALVSKGWGGLGADNVPENVFMLENTPHDWLFPRVSAVVHHGGAGTTAIGLKCGKPTMIVPFFGDQPFWGAMVAKAGAGAEPVPYKKLTAEKLTEGIEILLRPETQKAAQQLAKKIEAEGDGSENAVKFFLKALPMSGNHSMRCSIFEDRIAVWWLKLTRMRLSTLAAEMLVRQGKIKWSDLKLIRHYDWNDFEGPGEPFTGVGMAIAETIAKTAHGVGKLPFEWAKTIKRGNKKTDRKVGKARTADVDGATKGTNEAIAENEKAKDSMSTQKLPVDGLFGDSMGANLTKETGHGLVDSGRALARAPMDISLALAQGFHNAPRLYGDDTVRTTKRVTGIKSGLRTAVEEFGYGVYDGVTGIVKQPYHGFKEDGALGLLKGTGKGIGGFVLKDFAAICSLPAYTLKGLHEEIIKGRQPTKFIRRARILDGQRALVSLDQEALQDVNDKMREAWKVILALQREISIARSKGLRGRIAIYKGKRKWRRYGIFESTEHTRRALDAYRAGRTLEMDFGKMPEEPEGHNGPKDHLIDTKEEKQRKKLAQEKMKKNHDKKTSESDGRLIQAAKEEQKTQPDQVMNGNAQHLDVAV